MAEGPLSPDLDQVLGDMPSPQQSDLDMALSELGELPPPPPPSRSTGTKLGSELDDLLQDLPSEPPNRPPAPTTKPKPKAETKSDLIMRDIYKMLAEIEIDIEKNLTYKPKVTRVDTFGISSALKTLTNPATSPPPRNVGSPDGKPPIKSKPKPIAI